MSRIDWSKAPEGATHFCITLGVFCAGTINGAVFYRESGCISVGVFKPSHEYVSRPDSNRISVENKPTSRNNNTGLGWASLKSSMPPEHKRPFWIVTDGILQACRPMKSTDYLSLWNKQKVTP